MHLLRRFALFLARTPLVGLILAALVGLSLAGCTDQSSSAQRDVIGTLRIGVIGSVNVLTGPLGFAHSRGELLNALKPLGVDAVEVYSFPNGPDLNQALLGGRLDVGNYGDTPALVAKGSGLDTRLLAITQFNNDAGVVVKDPSIKSLKDLAGKKIGVPKGSYIDRYLQGALQQEGITAQLVHLYPADQEGPLSTGEIAGAALPGVIPSVALQSFQRKGYRLVDSVYTNHPGLAGTSVSVAANPFLAKQPDFGAAWQKLIADSVIYAKAHWDEYLAFEIKNSKANPADIRAAANPGGYAPEPFPAAGVRLLEGTKAFLVAQGSLKTDYSLNEWLYKPSHA
ncbi:MULTISPECIES: ABC transporter substrate-binding protein [unclassified Gordonia (in: high G+C Gram-positive bacteria)]|uniref:ABC transporter substrate-binding protein n=1 Tax=unclassified Gordonia (in: high G+C Gram-positive bacteria) TaxID=2657482 RepID=UPI001F0E03AD|nr:ABC transporter substrate-binding protein [Gordonia sp. ABSL49_1]MCH5644802.1 ABC transporter substrate-binding protein [Gordonia sp. ABSL49_1]